MVSKSRERKEKAASKENPLRQSGVKGSSRLRDKKQTGFLLP